MTAPSGVTLVLASSSPRRQELIRSLMLPAVIRASDADESVEEGMAPAAIVEELSVRKARAVADRLAEEGQDPGRRIVIGSDTIVVLDGEVLGKPADKEDAEGMLRRLQGREHQVYSGVACLDPANGQLLVRHRMTRVHMKPLRPEQITRYVETGEPMDKAGSYAIQGLGATIVDEIEGDYFNVVGLPLSLLAAMLSDMGIEVL
ncbi:Maf family protein [Gorillibacterium sp. sgz5001074]|uniref:Maf family protein n=1 Tax=Gorillibacterium sp. sgz5001074 TaxID=3446695 RepID=UPI003F674C47